MVASSIPVIIKKCCLDLLFFPEYFILFAFKNRNSFTADLKCNTDICLLSAKMDSYFLPLRFHSNHFNPVISFVRLVTVRSFGLIFFLNNAQWIMYADDCCFYFVLDIWELFYRKSRLCKTYIWDFFHTYNCWINMSFLLLYRTRLSGKVFCACDLNASGYTRHKLENCI